MADKKAILVLLGADEVADGGDAVKKFLKKAATASNYTAGDVAAEAAKVDGVASVDIDGLPGVMENGTAFACVDASGVADAEAVCANVLAAADRRTLVAVVAGKAVYFSGLGVKRGAKPEREVFAKDIVPTLCYVAELPVPDDATGAVIFQAFKDVNMKLKEIGKLQDAIKRMEAALSRGSHDPWDKHDCA